MSDATQLVQPRLKSGASMSGRTITLVPASGISINLLVPASSVAVNRISDLQDAIAIKPRDSALAAEFQSLVTRWKTDTQFLSGAAIELHPAYLRIIGMGDKAIPLILNEMKHASDHWFWALEAITGDNPAPNASTVAEATEAWLQWGKLRKLI